MKKRGPATGKLNTWNIIRQKKRKNVNLRRIIHTKGHMAKRDVLSVRAPNQLTHRNVNNLKEGEFLFHCHPNRVLTDKKVKVSKHGQERGHFGDMFKETSS